MEIRLIKCSVTWRKRIRTKKEVFKLLFLIVYMLTIVDKGFKIDLQMSSKGVLVWEFHKQSGKL